MMGDGFMNGKKGDEGVGVDWMGGEYDEVMDEGLG